MGRRKVSMGLIANRRVRVATFAKRKEGLKKKAFELSELCGVQVALVVAPADGDAAAEVWESEPGAVLARYRALGPEARARHTHVAYLGTELAKEEAKLARVRQGGPDALRPWDESFNAIATPEDAARLLADIDAALRAADDRRRALGMPPFEEDRAAAAAGMLEGVGLVAPGIGDEDDDFLLDAPDGDNGDDHHQQFIWAGTTATMQPHPRYGFQQMQCTTTSSGAAMDGYRHLLMAPPDMYGGGGSSFQPPNNAGMTQHGYFFQCTGGGGYFGVPAFQTQQVQGAQPPNNLAMWGTDEPRNALVPVAYPSLDTGLGHMDTPSSFFAAGASGDFTNSSLAMGTTTTAGGNFIINPPPSLSLAMVSSGDNDLTNVTQPQPLAMSYGGALINAGGNATQWQQAPRPQHGDGSSSQQSGIKQLHYLSDLDDTQLNHWGN